MKFNWMVCCLIFLLCVGGTFYVLEMIFGDDPVEVFDEDAPVGFGDIGFMIINESSGGNDVG